MPPLVLTESERDALEALVRKRTASQWLAQRARIVLSCAQESGTAPQTRIAARTGVSREMVRKWRVRFVEGGVDSLADTRRPGAPRRITDEQVEVVADRVLTEQGRGQDTPSLLAQNGVGVGRPRASPRP